MIEDGGVVVTVYGNETKVDDLLFSNGDTKPTPILSPQCLALDDRMCVDVFDDSRAMSPKRK